LRLGSTLGRVGACTWYYWVGAVQRKGWDVLSYSEALVGAEGVVTRSSED
jgi:hypothetical protein